MASESKKLETITNRPVCILVAEDDNAMREFLCNTLAKIGYDTREIANADDVYRFLGNDIDSKRGASEKENQVDVIITAISLPGKTALDVLNEFKYATYEVPIILITAFGDQQTVEEAMRNGAAAVFDKPFDIVNFTQFLTRLAPPNIPTN